MTPVGTRETPARSGAILQVEPFLREKWLVHGFSTRRQPRGGKAGFNLGFVEGADREEVERNRAEFVRAVTGSDRGWTLVQVKQIHSDIAHEVKDAPATLLTGDALATKAGGLLLVVKIADCVPVLLADRRQHAVAAVHAGWRGTAARVVEKAVGTMRRAFGSEPQDLIAAIGPCIRNCCYAVGDEVREQFRSQFDYAEELFVENFDVDPVRQKYPNLFLTARAPGHAEVSCQQHLDLVKANVRQLLAAGIPEGHIADTGLCTACNTELLFSHRAEQGKTGRLMAAIGIRP